MSLDTPKPVVVAGADAFRVGIVAARFNDALVEALLRQVVGTLRGAGVRKKNIRVERVPGSNELPSGAQLLALGEARELDVIIALGVIIRGGTIHYELVAEASAHALQRVALDLRVPVVNGVVVAENREQAEERCRGAIKRGAEFANTALEMAALRRRLFAVEEDIPF